MQLRMKYASGIILSILGWLGILVASPPVIMMGLMSGFASPREQSQIILTALSIPVVSVLTIMAGRAVTRSAKESIESKKFDD
jgi:hypothetical protein